MSAGIKQHGSQHNFHVRNRDGLYNEDRTETGEIKYNNHVNFRCFGELPVRCWEASCATHGLPRPICGRPIRSRR